MIFKLIDIKTGEVTFESIGENSKIAVVEDTVECKLYKYTESTVFSTTRYYCAVPVFKFRVTNLKPDQIQCAIQSALCSHESTNNYVELTGEYL